MNFYERIQRFLCLVGAVWVTIIGFSLIAALVVSMYKLLFLTGG